MTTTILLLTNRYPYGRTCESFVGNEVQALALLAREKGFRIVVAPHIPGSAKRPLPEGVEFTDALCVVPGLAAKIRCSIPEPGFWRDILRLLMTGRLNQRTLRSALAFFGLGTMLRKKLSGYIRQQKLPAHKLILYSYWSDYTAWAISDRRVPAAARVARAHGYDLYKERRANKYMPDGKLFTEKLDAVFCIADTGRDYFQKVYGISPAKLKLAYLGVADHLDKLREPQRLPAQLSSTEDRASLVLVSVSVVEPVKRVERLPELLTEYCQLSGHCIEWHHFGDGPDFEKLKQRVAGLEAKALRATLWGSVDNQDLVKHLQNLGPAIFVNVSASEGVPVSVMEAMMLGLPVIAPDVGGMKEIVSEQTGVLLPSDFSGKAFFAALEHVSENYKALSAGARALWQQKFHLERNTAAFAETLLAMAANRDNSACRNPGSETVP